MVPLQSFTVSCSDCADGGRGLYVCSSQSEPLDTKLLCCLLKLISILCVVAAG